MTCCPAVTNVVVIVTATDVFRQQDILVELDWSLMITVVVFDAQGQKVGPFGAGPIKGIFASLLDFLMDVSTWDRFRHTARY